MTRRRLQEIALVVVGVVTPIGILAVNGAAFVMRHLTEFRVGLAGAALVSGMLLNGLAAWAAIRFARRNAPLLYAEYRRVALVAAVLFVAVPSAIGAYWTYLGLVDPSQLPNRWGVLASLGMLGLPFAVTYVDRRYLRRREVAAEREEEIDTRPAVRARPRPR
ncbi:MAG TPA: hypothetical protein VF160_07310 [Candidatus Dormibacteraeota bacterium]